MQHPSLADSGLIGTSEAWQMAIEPWWPTRPEGGQLSTYAWIWAGGEMQEVRAVAVMTEEQMRDWAEIDLPLMLPGETC
jgi:hypothetical protein